MEDSLRFLYKKEFWHLSAFINTNEIIGETIAEDLERYLINRLHNNSEAVLHKSFTYLDKYPEAGQKKAILLEMAKTITIECDWEPFFHNFPYTDENNPYTKDNKDLVYNTLGYFRFEVDYFKDEPMKKEMIKPDLIQQIPFAVLDLLKAYVVEAKNEFLLLDLESPIHVFVVSTKMMPMEVPWTIENIEKYKKILGSWTQIYSGQWEDYSEQTFERRVKNNLSNRLSELHYVNKNSGFIYMKEQNFKTEFGYINRSILEPTPKVRAVVFALMTINNSLDVLFMKRYSDVFMSLDKIEKKTNNLRFLRGMIKTKMSFIYSELDWNRRQHYTRILTHLINEFRLEIIIKRVDKKFKVLYDSMQELYLKRNEEHHERNKRALNLVSILLSVGVLVDLATAMRFAIIYPEEGGLNQFIHIILAVLLGAILIAIIIIITSNKIKSKKGLKGYTVDAVILDDKNNVILIKRKYAPYKGKYALPGGFIKYDEDPRQTVIREVKEETNLAIQVIRKIGTYDQKGRDPRGLIVSTAYICQLIGGLSKMKEGDDASTAELIPISTLNEIDLAFDHKRILKDAGVL